MKDRIYLLDLEELTKKSESDPVFRSAEEMVDAERLRKAARVRSRAGRAASLGAGLLIQLAVAERELSTAFFRRFSAGGLLERLTETAGKQLPIPLAYRYGKSGKPYLRDIPLYFSLSHSGRFVLCAASEREIGADIQQMRPLRNLRVAERFFAPQEAESIRKLETQEEREREFYRLWARKEAYGKLIGEGIASAVSQDVEALEQAALWENVQAPEGYQLAICKYRE